MASLPQAAGKGQSGRKGNIFSLVPPDHSQCPHKSACGQGEFQAETLWGRAGSKANVQVWADPVSPTRIIGREESIHQVKWCLVCVNDGWTVTQFMKQARFGCQVTFHCAVIIQ